MIISREQITMHPLCEYLTEYKELNSGNKYRPVAVGRYGIRTRESIYSKDLAQDYSKNRLIYKGTLTVGMGSVQMDIGILSDDVVYSVSPAYHTYRISGIDYDYLRFCLQCRNMDMFTRFMKRGSRQGKSIDLDRWIGYEIPVYPREVQLAIVDRLNRAQHITDKLQHELDKLDELIKARFVEMFGDPISNSEGLRLVSLKDVCSKITDGTHDTPPRYQEGYLLITGKNVRPSGLVYDEIEYVCEEDHKIIYARCNPEYGDVLYTNIGVNYGTACFNDLDYEFSMKNVALLKPMKNVITGRYLWQCLNLMRDHILSMNQVGGAQTFMGLATIKRIEIPLPALESQNQFAAFVTQVDKSKVVVQKALDEAQMLFDSLMQKYFG